MADTLIRMHPDAMKAGFAFSAKLKTEGILVSLRHGLGCVISPVASLAWNIQGDRLEDQDDEAAIILSKPPALPKKGCTDVEIRFASASPIKAQYTYRYPKGDEVIQGKAKVGDVPWDGVSEAMRERGGEYMLATRPLSGRIGFQVEYVAAAARHLGGVVDLQHNPDTGILVFEFPAGPECGIKLALAPVDTSDA